MNGLTEITVGGEKYPLLFGIKAIRYIEESLMENFFEDAFEVNKAMIFGGLLNYASYVNKPVPKDFPQFVYNLVERWHDEPDVREQAEHIGKVFAESKFGGKLIENLEEKKKIVEAQIAELEMEMGVATAGTT